jgi:hypothetical protein
LTEEAIVAFFVDVPRVGILTHIFIESSKYMVKENEPGFFERLAIDYTSVIETHAHW